MAAKLEKHYNILYRGRDGLSAHEFIVDLRPFKASTGVVEEDVAKRLQVRVCSGIGYGHGRVVWKKQYHGVQLTSDSSKGTF